MSYRRRIKRPSNRQRKKEKQITGSFTITMSGQFLGMQLIYQGTTDRRCLPKGAEFSDDWNVTYTTNGSSS